MWDLTIHPPSESSILVGTHSLLQLMRDPTIHPPSEPASLLAHHLVSTPLWDSASSLAHRPVFGFDTIYNSPSPPLVNIIFFGLFRSGFPSNASARERFPHTLIKNVSFSSPTDVGSHVSYLSSFHLHLQLTSSEIMQGWSCIVYSNI